MTRRFWTLQWRCWLLVVCNVLVCLVVSVNVVSASPDLTQHQLRIETGMHTARINRCDIDAHDKYFVTCSHDKTVRVWELQTGRLLRVLRPPSLPGSKGMMFAAAITADGRYVACGGLSVKDGNKEFSVYIFYRPTGQIVRRISGFSSVIFYLAFSPDGHYLVVTLPQKGIRIYNTWDYSLVKKDELYGGHCRYADFDWQGRLVTVCYDGYLRLYSRETFELVSKGKTKRGVKPAAVRFSPDKKLVAVGYNDSFAVDVYSGADLTYLYSADTRAVNGPLESVAWSSDGQILYAGGSHDWNSYCPILSWDKQGKGSMKIFETKTDTIMDLHAIKSGGVLFCSYDPAFGRINKRGEKRLFRKSDIGDFRKNRETLRVSESGAEVLFALEREAKSPVFFNLTDRLLSRYPDSSISLFNARQSGPRLRITDWKNTYKPKLNGTPIPLAATEISRSLACSSDGSFFVLGSERNIRCFSETGELLWKQPVKSTAWAVSLSGNNKLVVAAVGDGTIQWFRRSDGKKLLTLFVHRDQKRWVCWTPSGAYDTSTGGDVLLGWHKNNGLDKAADFFSASRFRSVYYQPDVVRSVLDTLDEAMAVKQVSIPEEKQKQMYEPQPNVPPVVTILAPADNEEISSPTLTVRYTVRESAADPVKRIHTLIDGRPVSSSRGLQLSRKKENERVLNLEIPPRDCEVTVIAESGLLVSEAEIIRIRWKKPVEQRDTLDTPVTETFVIKPKLYILSIGVGAYTNRDLKLHYPAKDARDFVNAFLSQKGTVYRDVAHTLLVDDKANKGAILDGLDWLEKQTTSKDIAILFFAGHGVNDFNGIFYFLPYGVHLEKLKRTALPFTDIKNTVSSLASKTLLFIDSCHSGNIMGARRGTADIISVVNELVSAENGVIVFASSTGRQFSLENDTWQNGAFTKAVVEGVSGRADYTHTGKITVNMLDLYISERVKELTGGKQTPTTTKPQTISDFPIALVQ